MRHARVLSLLWIACACVMAPAIAQQDWPAKPIRIVVANSPGAATDLAGRVFADNLSRVTNRPVAVENRPGADGYIAAEAVAKAAPDGYTLFFASQSVFALDPNIKKSMPVDPVRDFTPLGVTIDDTGATGIFVHPTSSYKTLPELFAYAKTNPGKLSFATTVPLFGMMGAWINKRAGTQMVEVPYKATAQANADALSGQVQIILTAFGPFEQYVKAGRTRTLAVTKAVEGYPEIPPLTKFFPDFEQPSFVILAGPAGMNGDLAQRVNRLTASIVENPKFNADLATVRWRNLEGARSLAGTVEFIREKRARWAAYIKEIGIEPH